MTTLAKTLVKTLAIAGLLLVDAQPTASTRRHVLGSGPRVAARESGITTMCHHNGV
jgi:hypothetical protein